jgi:hypothetical protein
MVGFKQEDGARTATHSLLRHRKGEVSINVRLFLILRGYPFQAVF